MENYFQLNFTPAQVREVSNGGLAHLGDGVFSLLCRAYLCCRGDRTLHRLHYDAVALVNASAQARFAEALAPLLTPEETDYYRRGKNAHTHAPPKAATHQAYAMATGLEALFGALYLLGRTERLNELFARGMEALDGI